MRTTGSRSLYRFALSAFALVFVGLLPGLVAGCGRGNGETDREPTVGADGESVVTVRRSPDGVYVEQDNRRVSDTYEFVQGVRVTPSGDLVYAGRRKDGKWVVMRNDKPVGEAHEYVAGVTTNPDGEVTYLAKDGDRWHVMRNGIPEGEGYENISRPVYSPDGEELAYTVTENNRTFLVRGGVRQPGEYEWADAPQFSPDGESLIFVAQVGEDQQVVMRDGERITPPIDGNIETWAISSDGQSSVVVNRHEWQNYVIRNGRTIAGPLDIEAVTRPVFAPDERTVFYGVAESGRRWVIYRDDQKFTDDIEASALADLLVSPDGSAVACSARRDGQWYVLKNGQVVSDGFHKISNLRNGPDGNTFLFAGVLGSSVTEVEIEW